MAHADFLDFLNAGTLGFQPFAVVGGKRILPERMEFSSKKNLHITCVWNEKFSDDFYFTRNANGISCRRTFRNNGNAAVRLNELGIVLSGITFGGKPSDDYFYHNENPRIYERMTFPVDYSRTKGDAKDSNFDSTAGNRWADPGVVCDRIGRSPYQPFPAIHIGNYASGHGIVHGTLSQRTFYHNYLVFHENGTVTLEIYSSFKDLEFLELAPGRVLTDEWMLCPAEHSGDLERVFESYSAELRRKLPVNYGATDINRTSMVWGSWNDGIMRDVSEDMLLRETAFLAENFPAVRWVQLDDGYAVYDRSAHGLGVPYEGEAGIDQRKFPHGLRHYTDKVRELGLRPAVWIGGFCPHETKIFQEHPEWFSDYSLRVKDASPLDVSQPEVRKYMEHALDVLISDDGFEGVKHDFWSYAFEDSHDLYENKDESGYFYRSWWLKELRKRLPADGYLQTGCDIVMGNPFLGEYFTNYRYGIDIGSGNWDYVRTNFLWGIACFATHTGDLFVPNSDSVGIFPGLNDTDAMFALNYCLVTHSMVEIAGKLSQCDPENPRFLRLKKAVCAPNNGQDVFLARYDYRSKTRALPSVLYFRTPFFSALEGNPALPAATAGLFNTLDTPLETAFRPADLGLPEGKYHLRNIWTHEVTAFPESGAKFTLPPHGSMVLAVIPEKAFVLEDCSVKIVSAVHRGRTFVLETAFDSKSAEFLFPEKVRGVKSAGKAVPFENRNGECVLVSAPAGTYEFKF